MDTPSLAPADALERSLTNIPPTTQSVVGRMEDLRTVAKGFGFALLAAVPPSLERSLAITKLEESVMWAMKGIALNQGDDF